MKQRFSQICYRFLVTRIWCSDAVGRALAPRAPRTAAERRPYLALMMLMGLVIGHAPILSAQGAAPQTQDKAPVAEVAVPETQSGPDARSDPTAEQAQAPVPDTQSGADTLLRQGSEGHGNSGPTAEPAPSVPVVLEAATPAPVNGPDTRSDPTGNQAPAEPQWIYRGEVVVFGNDVLIRENERASKVVAIGGDVKVRGRVDGEVVAIGGDVKVDGPVRELVVIGGDVAMFSRVAGEVVVVGGDMEIHGPVGKLVAVFGDVTLGPKASVAGEVVAVLGEVDNPHQVSIGGQSVELGGFIPLPKFSGILAWGRDAIGNVRLLSPHVAWPWYVFGGCALFYLLLATVFGRGVNACARVLEESPGTTLVTAIALLPLLPLFTLLLILTGVGVLLLPFLAVALLFAGAFGKTAVLAFLGRSVLRPCGAESAAERAWLTVLIGVVLLALLYCVPVVGLLLWALTAWVGFGMVAAALLQNRRREKARIEAQREAARAEAAATTVNPGAAANPFVAPETAATPESRSMAAGGEAAVGAQAGVAPEPPVLQPPARIPLEAITLPRADFWLRLGALLIDIVLVAVATGVTVILSFLPFPLVFGAYAFGFWLWKGTTIGGIVFNLKVVRLDGRPIDAATALVRTLVAFLSVCAAGLGFLWCLWDPEGQTWHDKVAGTVVVRVPKATPLV